MKAQLRTGKVATALKGALPGASRLAGGVALLVCTVAVTWWWIGSLQSYLQWLGHARSPLFLITSLFIIIAVAGYVLVQGVAIASYIVFHCWRATFRRPFPVGTTKGNQS
ncbi:UNVERIFIED_ORG: hypothetical protein ABIC54_005984 [Burkholderia sp. 1263]